MEDEFNPTRKDLLNIEELILSIKARKNILVQRKISLQNSLSQLHERYKDVKYKSRDFDRIKTTRRNVKNHLHGIELKIKSLNEELIFKNKLRLEIEFHIKHKKQLESKEDVDRLMTKITALKVKYNDFTKDKTRIASLRIMAAEFVDDLNDLF